MCWIEWKDVNKREFFFIVLKKNLESLVFFYFIFIKVLIVG